MMKPDTYRILLRALLVLLVLTTALSAWVLVVTPKQRESRAEVNSHVFAPIAKDTTWDMQKPMLWGYFFVSEWKLPLEVSRGLLGLVGFRYVGLIRQDEGPWQLHVECIEVHDVDTLSDRDVRLSRFASLLCSEYDGWDVGPPGKAVEHPAMTQ